MVFAGFFFLGYFCLAWWYCHSRVGYYFVTLLSVVTFCAKRSWLKVVLIRWMTLGNTICVSRVQELGLQLMHVTLPNAQKTHCLTSVICSDGAWEVGMEVYLLLSIRESNILEDYALNSIQTWLNDRFFFLLSTFFFSFHTQHHNTTSIKKKTTKQNNRHILNIPKVQSKGRERGKDKENTKQVIPKQVMTISWSHMLKKKTLPSINSGRLSPINLCCCIFTSHYLQEAMDPICFSTHVRCKPVLYYCLLRSCKTSKQHSLLY